MSQVICIKDGWDHGHIHVPGPKKDEIVTIETTYSADGYEYHYLVEYPKEISRQPFGLTGSSRVGYESSHFVAIPSTEELKAALKDALMLQPA